MTVIKKINSICANFAWKSKVHKMNWDDICKPKQEGGLGLRKIEDMEKAVTIKLIWKFLQGEIYGPSGCVINIAKFLGYCYK